MVLTVGDIKKALVKCTLCYAEDVVSILRDGLYSTSQISFVQSISMNSFSQSSIVLLSGM